MIEITEDKYMASTENIRLKGQRSIDLLFDYNKLRISYDLDIIKISTDLCRSDLLYHSRKENATSPYACASIALNTITGEMFINDTPLSKIIESISISTMNNFLKDCLDADKLNQLLTSSALEDREMGKLLGNLKSNIQRIANNEDFINE